MSTGFFAKILSHEIDHDSMEIVENGILAKASENAQNVLYKIVYNDVVASAGYKVTFVELDEE